MLYLLIEKWKLGTCFSVSFLTIGDMHQLLLCIIWSFNKKLLHFALHIYLTIEIWNFTNTVNQLIVLNLLIFILKKSFFFFCCFFRDASFHAHLEFLKSQGIAGISHHSLLFSKTEPVQEAPAYEVENNHW